MKNFGKGGSLKESGVPFLRGLRKKKEGYGKTDNGRWLARIARG